MGALLNSEIAQTHRFLTALAGCEAVTFQTFSDRDDLKREGPGGKVFDPFAGWRHGLLHDLESWLGCANRRGAGIFVMVNAGDGKGRKAENVVRIRALFIDTDGAPYPTDPPLKPHLVVESSPGRWHLYWLVDGLLKEHFGVLQRALAEHYGTDPSVKDLPRVMRLPGFHHKKGEPVMVKLEAVNDMPPYTPADVLLAWPKLGTALSRERHRQELKTRVPRRLDALPGGTASQARADRLLEIHFERVANAGSGTRHSTLRGSACALGGYVATGCVSEDEAAVALRDAASACGLPNAEAESVIRWGLTNGAKRPLDLTLSLPQNLHTKGAALTRWGRLSNRLKEWDHARD